jgi:hypothetical protein
MLFIISPNLGFEFSRSFLFVVFCSGANLNVGLEAPPEVSLEVEVEVGRSLPICLDSEGSVPWVKVKVM